MKKITIIVIFICVQYISFSQDFKVDCGNDTIFCMPLNVDTFYHLGTTIKLSNGNAPYTYKWSCEIYRVGSSNLTASTFLNDTTLLNPYFKDFPLDDDRLIFYLTVKDSNDNVAIDTINTRFSRFAYWMGYYSLTLNIGDSIRFSDLLVGGGIKPLKYNWTPSRGLSDSTETYPWCKPLISTDYYIQAIDSVGCESEFNLVYKLNVIPAQTIVDTTKRWNTLIHLQPSFTMITENIKFKGDTIIDSKDYKRVFRSTDEFQTIWKSHGFIRETNDKVYYRMDSTQEYLLYDFNVGLNDTIEVYGMDGFGNGYYMIPLRFRVSLIDSIFLGGVYRKQIHLNHVNSYDIPNMTEVWIEGIGSKCGILHGWSGLVGGNSYELLCHSQNNTLIYQHTAYTSCYLNTSEDLLSIGDVFDFEINDEFHITDNYKSPNSERFIIKDKYYSINSDTIFYNIFYNNYNSIYNPNNDLIYNFDTITKLVYYTNLDSSIYTYFNYLNYNTLRNQQINNPEFYFTYDSIIENSQILCDVKLNGFQVTIGEFEPNTYHYEFGKGLGVTYNEFVEGSGGTNIPLYSKKLFYYKKGNIICGVPDLTTEISRNFSSINKYAIVQNAKINSVTIIPDILTSTYEIEVYSITGRTIYKSPRISGYFNINGEDIGFGINILKIRALNGYTEVHKIIILNK